MTWIIILDVKTRIATIYTNRVLKWDGGRKDKENNVKDWNVKWMWWADYCGKMVDVVRLGGLSPPLSQEQNELVLLEPELCSSSSMGKENRWSGRSKVGFREGEESNGCLGMAMRASSSLLKICPIWWSASVRKTRASSTASCKTTSSFWQALSLARASSCSLANVARASRARVRAMVGSSWLVSPPLVPMSRRRRYSWSFCCIALLAAMLTLDCAFATSSRV